MFNEDQIEDYTSKLKRFLTTPSSAKEYFDAYEKESSEATDFDAYTKKLDDLVSRLETREINDSDSLCREVKKLKLPQNQFGC